MYSRYLKRVKPQMIERIHRLLTSVFVNCDPYIHFNVVRVSDTMLVVSYRPPYPYPYPSIGVMRIEVVGENVSVQYGRRKYVGISMIYANLWNFMHLNQQQQFESAMECLMIMVDGHNLLKGADNSFHTIIMRDGRHIMINISPDLMKMYYEYGAHKLECPIHKFHKFARVINSLPTNTDITTNKEWLPENPTPISPMFSTKLKRDVAVRVAKTQFYS